ncbi:MAG: ATP-grasp domain-containing protein [Chloroflexota bacterium]
MAHLLMVDSWVTEMGQFLPQAIERLGHTFTFATRDLTHYLKKPSPKGWHPLLNARSIVTTDTNDAASLIAWAERYHQFAPFDGVITSCDYYLSTVAQLAEHFGLPTTPPDAFETARLKHRMRAALDRAGLPNARYKVTTTWKETRAAAEAIGYPVVLKPTDLCSSMFVVVARDEQTLRGAFDQLDDFPINTRKITREPIFLVEEYLRGEEISVEAFTFDGQTTILGLTDKSLSEPPAFIETGHMTPAIVSPENAEATIDLVQKSLRAVGYTHGLSHTEVKLTPDGPRIVEINVRCGGGHISQLYRLTQGVDPVEMMVQLALGQRPTYEPKATGVQSATVMYYVAPRGGTVGQVRGLDGLDRDPNVVEWHLPDLAGTTLREPIDNNDCLGHVLTVDREGSGARAKAEAALARIELSYADERVGALA